MAGDRWLVVLLLISHSAVKPLVHRATVARHLKCRYLGPGPVDTIGTTYTQGYFVAGNVSLQLRRPFRLHARVVARRLAAVRCGEKFVVAQRLAAAARMRGGQQHPRGRQRVHRGRAPSGARRGPFFLRRLYSTRVTTSVASAPTSAAKRALRRAATARWALCVRHVVHSQLGCAVRTSAVGDFRFLHLALNVPFIFSGRSVTVTFT